MKMKGSESEQNLLKAFAGESQARNRYTFFASVAKKEGYEKAAAIFAETAEQEKEHAKRFFNFLEGGDLSITATFPAGKIGTTLDNLKASAEGEHHEWNTLYPEFALIARKEGFEAVAKAFDAISIAEKRHEERYNKLYTLINDKHFFKQKDSVLWRCRNCGYLHTGLEAPNACPACIHPQAFFEISYDILSL